MAVSLGNGKSGTATAKKPAVSREAQSPVRGKFEQAIADQPDADVLKRAFAASPTVEQTRILDNIQRLRGNTNRSKARREEAVRTYLTLALNKNGPQTSSTSANSSVRG